MATINPYLTFNGNCEEAFNFYKSVFGGDFPYVGRFKDMPAGQGFEVSEEDKERIMHMSLPISEETTLMGSDTTSQFGADLKEGTNYSISINCKTQEETEKLFNGLSEGGIVKMPLSKTFWGSYFGMFADKFGINWMVSCELGEKPE